MPARELLIVFMRHGETEANRAGIIQGSGCDFPLTQAGIDGANMTGYCLREAQISWDYVCSSPLLRALRTANIIVSHSVDKGKLETDVEIEQLKCVRERGAGVLEGMHFSTSLEKAKQLAAVNQGVPPGEVDNSKWESVSDVRERHQEFLNHVIGKDLAHGSKILCVCHGAFITLFLRYMCSGNKREKLGHSVANCSLSGVRVMYGDGKIRCFVDTCDYTDHLYIAMPGTVEVDFERDVDNKDDEKEPIFEWLKSYRPIDDE